MQCAFVLYGEYLRPGVLPDVPVVVDRDVIHHDGRGADFSFTHNRPRRALSWFDRQLLATGIDTILLEGGNMWHRVEDTTETCTCGGVAEKWVLFGRAKVLNQTYICHKVCQACNLDYLVGRAPRIHVPGALYHTT